MRCRSQKHGGRWRARQLRRRRQQKLRTPATLKVRHCVTTSATKENHATRSATRVRRGGSEREAPACGRQRRHRRGDACDGCGLLGLQRRHFGWTTQIAAPLTAEWDDTMEATATQDAHNSLSDCCNDAQRRGNRRPAPRQAPRETRFGLCTVGTNIAGGASVLTAGLGEGLRRSTGRRDRTEDSEGATTFGQRAVVTPRRAAANRETSTAFNESAVGTNSGIAREAEWCSGSGRDSGRRTGPLCAMTPKQCSRERGRQPTTFNDFSFTAVRPNV